MDEIKYKVLGLINKQKEMKIPTMGFSEYFIQNALVPGTYATAASTIDKINGDKTQELSDQEILESTEPIYFEENVNTENYELEKLTKSDKFECATIEASMVLLKKQHKVISKKVLQLILEQRASCDDEFLQVSETENMLKDSVKICQKARSCLSDSKKQLTTTSLEILATYKKRQILLDLLETLNTLKSMRSIDQHLQKLLDEENYSGAISILLENKNLSEKYSQYKCVESLSLKLQDTLILTEVQLENVLSEIPQNFDTKKYAKLQEAYSLLGKTLITMDQLHMNFISAIHSTAFSVLKNNVLEQNAEMKLFEQICDSITPEKYIPCLIELCKAFWKILVSYYQVSNWHQNQNTPSPNKNKELTHDEYIQEKLKKGQYRLWNDIQSKICIYLNSTKLHQLKYEYFIQILAIVQRIKKVGMEFCDEPSEKMMESMRKHSLEFFKRYHSSCLEEINLFLDHEIWVQISSFNDVTQLQEYRTLKRALQRYKVGDLRNNNRVSMAILVENSNVKSDSSTHSQDESSIYGSCGYFLRFTEKSSPFDGGFDSAMLEEDILAGIADESSCYYSEDSSDTNDNYDDQVTIGPANQSNIIVSNTSLTVLRCIGRYLHFCKLLHSISPHIVMSMTELIDFYIYSVHTMFSKDLPVSGDNLYSVNLRKNLIRISTNIIPKLKRWPPSAEMIEMDLLDADQMFGMMKRIVGVESCISLIEQFEQMAGYLEHVLPITANEDKQKLSTYIHDTKKYICDLRKPIYMCVTSRVTDVPTILLAMSKVKWEINHVTVQHSGYIDILTRGIQTFAMRLEEISSHVIVPKESLWDCFAHILTHLLVEGFSNAKKCSTGGRQLMQLDFTHFISMLELISGMKHPTHQSYVEQYVKAYYLPKDSLEEWIKEQTGYSQKHFAGLIGCACSNDKKMRQKLLAIVDSNNCNGNNLATT